MKKILALLICAVMLTSLVACNIPAFSGQGNGGTQNTNGEKKEYVNVEFTLKGGTVVSGAQSIQIEKGKTLSGSDIPDVEKQGYIFEGWAYDVNGISMWVPEDSFSSDTRLYAIWVADASAVPGDSEDSSDITDSSQPSDTTDSSESNDTTNTSNTTDSSESNNTTDTSDTTDSSESNNTTDTSDTTDSSSTTSSSDSGNTTKPSTPTIVPDRTQYQPSVVGDKEAIYYINSIVRHPLLTPYYDGYQAALTMTFDDGYDSNTGVIVSDTLERFGYRGTMMLGACFMDSDTIIKEWNDIFARGPRTFFELMCGISPCS